MCCRVNDVLWLFGAHKKKNTFSSAFCFMPHKWCTKYYFRAESILWSQCRQVSTKFTFFFDLEMLIFNFHFETSKTVKENIFSLSLCCLWNNCGMWVFFFLFSRYTIFAFISFFFSLFENAAAYTESLAFNI